MGHVDARQPADAEIRAPAARLFDPPYRNGAQVLRSNPQCRCVRALALPSSQGLSQSRRISVRQSGEKRLVRGDIYVHTVVIPEGYTIFDIAQTVQDSGLGSSEDFLRAAQANVALISDLAPEAKTLEGYLFPSTYEFTRTQSMPEMV